MSHESQTYFSFDREIDWKPGIVNTWKIFDGVSGVEFTVYPKFLETLADGQQYPNACIWSSTFESIADMIEFVTRNRGRIIVNYVNGFELRFATRRGVNLAHLMEDSKTYTFYRMGI